MQSVKFTAKIKDSDVEALVEPKLAALPENRSITSLEIDTRDFNFDREETNER